MRPAQQNQQADHGALNPGDTGRDDFGSDCTN